MPYIPPWAPKKNNAVQAVLISKKLYNERQAQRLLNIMGYYFYDQRETDNYFRYRQITPRDGWPKFTKKSTIYPGVKFIIEMEP